MAWKKEDSTRIWPPEPGRRASELESEFKGNLRSIADRLAVHEGLKRVDEKHVNAAFETLANAGLRRRRWVDRPESEASLGTFCLGFCFACPDVINALFGEENGGPFSKYLMAVFFALGVVLFAHGTYRATLPSPSQYRKGMWRLVRRVGLIALTIVLLVAAGFVTYARFLCPTCGSTSSDLVPTPAAASQASDDL